MCLRIVSVRAATAKLIAAWIGSVFAMIMLAVSPVSAASDIRWGTGPVGSSGQKALVVLADVLNRAIPEYRISVLPTAGAITTVKGFAMGEFDGYYGSDLSLKELRDDSGRFKDFKSNIKFQPVQSFWCYTLDVGLAIKASDRDAIEKWEDLSGKPVYTGPLPFDVRLYLENAMVAAGVHHIYRQVDLSTVGSQLNSGSIKGMLIYAAGGETPVPWLAEASLSVDWAALNPSPDELQKLNAQGFTNVEVDPANFHKKDLYVKKVTLLPMYWGFDLGLNVSADDMYKMLKVIEAHADELATLDPSFRQISGGKMAEFQKEALQSTWTLAPIHPGLARYLKEKGVWDAKWDTRIAKM